MPIRLSIKHNFAGVQRSLDQLREDIGRKALVSAVNKTLDQARTQMQRAIVAEFNVTTSYVRDRLRIRRATAKGGVTIEGSLIGGKEGGKRSANIIAFVERKTSLAQARRRRKAGTLNQLFVKVRRTGQAKPLPGAFIGNKGRTVFRRVGRSRLPIEPVQTIDVAQMFNTRRVNKVVLDAINAKFPAIFEHEAAFYFDRFNRAGR